MNEKFVLISDIEPFHSDLMGYYLKVWADRYPFLAEVKGGSMKIRPEIVVVTSKFKIEQMWTGSVFSAIWRRFHKIYKIDNEIKLYKREKHSPSRQYIPYLSELISNVSNRLLPQEANQPSTSKEPTLAEKENLRPEMRRIRKMILARQKRRMYNNANVSFKDISFYTLKVKKDDAVESVSNAFFFRDGPKLHSLKNTSAQTYMDNYKWTKVNHASWYWQGYIVCFDLRVKAFYLYGL